jgi:hypothetical protein
MLRPWRVALDPGPVPIEVAMRSAMADASVDPEQRLVSFAPLERAFVVRLSDDEARALAAAAGVRGVTPA